MSWELHRVSLKLLSPLHIGWRKIGNLQQTRYYVPGRTLWGALTARLARDCGEFDYMKTGIDVDRFLRFSYFYPSDNEERITFFPWDKRDEFEWKFIGSTVNTALNLGAKIADEGSLHETEYIAPRTRDGKQVYLIGYIFEHKDCRLNWKDALTKLHIGGERTYGWGRVEIDGSKGCAQVAQFDLDGYDIELDQEFPVIKLSASRSVISHVLADNQIDGSASSGNIEPLIGLETTKEERFGAEISAAQICWTPGTKFSNDHTFVIGEKGIWKSKS
ncbi:RAMP superfamily CRISPR-associated protein [Mesotoga sp.]|uniref:RAMP superfamily CRISPR-associated protein n=1 Tax=Mesotoga sp. TaxID=2053577 RepID=UPI001BD1F057|nr:RAMP superfamily CRISPR-associated protein [Mesotoga sp.]